MNAQKPDVGLPCSGRWIPPSRTVREWACRTIHHPINRHDLAETLLDVRRLHGTINARAFSNYLTYLGTYPSWGSSRSNRFWARAEYRLWSRIAAGYSF